MEVPEKDRALSKQAQTVGKPLSPSSYSYTAGGCNLELNRWVYMIAACAQMCLVAGAISGWPNMAAMLENSGVFDNDCKQDSPTCFAKMSETVASIYTMATVISCVTPMIFGWFLDHYGPRLTLQIMTGMYVVGTALLITALKIKSSSLVFGAFALMATAPAMNSCFFHCANAFPRQEGLMLSILNGAFDAGTAVYLIMALINDAGMPLGEIMIGFLCGPLLVFLLLAFLLWRRELFHAAEAPEPIDTPIVTVSDSSGDLDMSKPLLQRKGSGSSPATALDTAHPGVDRKALRALPFLRQIATPEFLLFVAFLDASLLRVVFFLGSAKMQLDLLGQVDDEYTRILGAILPLGFLAQFAVGPAIDYCGLLPSMVGMWALGVVASIIQLVPVLALQPLVFILMVLYRAVTFTIMTVYVARHFGYATMGQTLGVLLLIGGAVAALPAPLVSWATKRLEDGVHKKEAFAAPNAFMLAVSIACGAFLVWYAVRDGQCRCCRRRGAQ